jgi:hypothetical protein
MTRIPIHQSSSALFDETALPLEANEPQSATSATNVQGVRGPVVSQFEIFTIGSLAWVATP